MKKKIPLAWLELSREKIRFLVALCGIGFAAMLMFTQLGFRDALYDSAIRVHKILDADLFLINPKSETLIRMDSFSRRRLYETLANKGVESVSSLYVNFGLWKDPWEDPLTRERYNRNIMIFGFDPEKPVFSLPEVNQKLDKLKTPDVVLFDQKSRNNFGPVVAEIMAGKPIITEVNKRRIKVVGLFSIGTSFGVDASLITSDLNFVRLINYRSLEDINLGLIKVKAEYNIQEVARQIAAELPRNVKVMTRKQFMDFEKKRWSSGTPIGFIFNQGVVISFIVGAVIVYQILYSNVCEHLPEYATLKAMGYKDIYLLIVVFQEAIILAILGYIPGFALSLGVYDLAVKATLLPVGMSFNRAVMVLVLTVLMCLISGAIAVRKLRYADPADIF